jgi:hypothetical protein
MHGDKRKEERKYVNGKRTQSLYRQVKRGKITFKKRTDKRREHIKEESRMAKLRFFHLPSVF